MLHLSKPFTRFNPLVCLGTTLVSLALSIPTSAAALTSTEIGQKLASIPVFFMGSSDGSQFFFIEESVETDDGNQTSITRIYFNPEDAEADLALIREGNADLPENVGVATISLGEVFCISLQNSDQACEQAEAQPEQASPPDFIYFPDRDQLDSAVQLLEQQGADLGEDVPLFVPLFFTRLQLPDQEPRTLPVLSFGLESLQQEIAAAQENTPELAAAEFNIQVVAFGQVIDQLISADEPGQDDIQFIPLRFDQ